MSTRKNEQDQRVWSDDFIRQYNNMDTNIQFKTLIKGLQSVGFKRSSSTRYDPISEMVDLYLHNEINVRLYLVRLDDEFIICYRVGIYEIDTDTDATTIFKLNENTIWSKIRSSWVSRQ